MSQNRFDKLLKTARTTQPPDPESTPDIQTSKHLDVPAAKAKSSSKEFKRTTLYLSQELHHLLKRASVDQGLEMSTIAEVAIRQWLEDKNFTP